MAHAPPSAQQAIRASAVAAHPEQIPGAPTESTIAIATATMRVTCLTSLEWRDYLDSVKEQPDEARPSETIRTPPCRPCLGVRSGCHAVPQPSKGVVHTDVQSHKERPVKRLDLRARQPAYK